LLERAEFKAALKMAGMLNDIKPTEVPLSASSKSRLVAFPLWYIDSEAADQ
jgi:hypothetical protein